MFYFFAKTHLWWIFSCTIQWHLFTFSHHNLSLRNSKVKDKRTSSLSRHWEDRFLPRQLGGDTWLMAVAPGPLNNGRLTHNHLRREEDSLWPYHLPLPIPRPGERWRETETKRKTKRERVRENYSVNPEAREEGRERLRVRIVSSCLWCLTLVDSAKTENHRVVPAGREREKKKEGKKISLWAAALQPQGCKILLTC